MSLDAAAAAKQTPDALDIDKIIEKLLEVTSTQRGQRNGADGRRATNERRQAVALCPLQPPPLFDSSGCVIRMGPGGGDSGGPHSCGSARSNRQGERARKGRTDPANRSGAGVAVSGATRRRSAPQRHVAWRHDHIFLLSACVAPILRAHCSSHICAALLILCVWLQ